MINIAIQNSTDDMTSGASYALLSLAKEIKKGDKYNPIIILPKAGELNDLLKQANIETYIVQDFRRDMWSVDLNYYHKFNFPSIKNQIKIAMGPLLTINCVKRIKQILVDRDIKLVHVNMLTCGLVGQVAIDMGIPVVWHMREFLEEDIGVKILNPKKRYGIINSSDRLIAISEGVKNKFEKIFTPKIAVVYDGVTFDPTEVKRHQILTEDKVKAIIAGRVCRNKGQMELAQAFESLHEEYGLEYELSIYGSVQEEDYLQKIQDFANKHRAEKRILYKGRSSTVRKQMQKADIMGVCSNQEAFGLVTVEGQMAGCLVIGADSGATKELIDSGSTGYVYHNHDVQQLASIIWKAVQDKETSNMIAKSGQEHAINTYTAANNAKGVMEIYDEVLAKAGK